MQPTIIEGTWEEIERRKAELIGRQLRVTILPETPARNKNGAIQDKAPAQSKKLVGFGAFKDALPSTEEYPREKHEETRREDATLK